MNEHQSRNYILSQRFVYLALGMVAGYMFGTNNNYIFLLVFTILAVIIHFYFNYKSRKSQHL